MAQIQKVYKETSGNVTTTAEGNTELYPVCTSESVYCDANTPLSEKLTTLATASSVSSVADRVEDLEDVTQDTNTGNAALGTKVTAVTQTAALLSGVVNSTTIGNSKLNQRLSAIEQSTTLDASTWPDSPEHNALLRWVGSDAATGAPTGNDGSATSTAGRAVRGMTYKCCRATNTYTIHAYEESTHETEIPSVDSSLDTLINGLFNAFTNRTPSGSLEIHAEDIYDSVRGTHSQMTYVVFNGETVASATGSSATTSFAPFVTKYGLTPTTSGVYVNELYFTFTSTGSFLWYPISPINTDLPTT